MCVWCVLWFDVTIFSFILSFFFTSYQPPHLPSIFSQLSLLSYSSSSPLTATPISESMISSLYRYLCGYGNALLTDPALHGKVYGLMTKLFKRLLSVLKKLGTTIVYASFSRIIIHTDKEVRIWYLPCFRYLFSFFFPTIFLNSCAPILWSLFQSSILLPFL